MPPVESIGRRPDPRGAGGGPEPERHPGFGSGTRLWLVRHARVHPDWHGRAYGRLDVPLGEEGLAQTRERARTFGALPLEEVASSPLERAFVLAGAIAEASGAPLSIDPRLVEIDRGAWCGRTVAELHEREAEAVAAFYADPWTFREHGGECDRELWERVRPALEELVERRRGNTVLVACHYNVIRVAAGRFLGIPPARSFAFRVDPAGAALFVDGAGGWVLSHSNVSAPATREPDPEESLRLTAARRARRDRERSEEGGSGGEDA